MQLFDEFQEITRRTDEEEAIINGKISVLRLELSRLKDSRYELKQRVRTAEIEKESLLRKIELEKEAEQIQRTLEEKRKEAYARLATAPWFDPTYTKEGFAFKWQVDGALQLPPRALLGDKRGMGKTLSALIWRRVHNVKKTLVCVRQQVASDFIKEIGIREPGLFVYPLLGANSDNRQVAAMLLDHHEEFVVVTNIESWRRNIDKTIADILRINYDGVILDEAHHIKNIGTGTAQGFLKIAMSLPKVFELTGTPIKNQPQEMFILLHALYPHLFPKESKFLVDYCVQMSQNRWVFSGEGVKSLVKKISSFYLARSPEDVGRKVPPPHMIEYKLNFDNHPEQRDAYRLMTERSMALLGSGKVIPVMSQLAIMTRQAQMVSWPAGIKFVDQETGEVVQFDVFQSVKADWAEDFIQELVAEGERVVLFSRFKPAIYELQNRLKEAGLSVAVITGEEKRKGNTEEILNDFDLKTAPKDPKFNVLLATYQTIGESVNLNAAGHVILYDRYWNPGNDDQAIGRVDRINSVKQATVHLPTVEFSIDEYMVELIDGKRNMVMEFRTASERQSDLMKHLEKSL